MPFTLSHVAAALPLRRAKPGVVGVRRGQHGTRFPLCRWHHRLQEPRSSVPRRDRIHASGIHFRPLAVSCRPQAARRNFAPQQRAAKVARRTRELQVRWACPFRGHLVLHRVRYCHSPGLGYVYPSAQLVMVAMVLAADCRSIFRWRDLRRCSGFCSMRAPWSGWLLWRSGYCFGIAAQPLPRRMAQRKLNSGPLIALAMVAVAVAARIPTRLAGNRLPKEHGTDRRLPACLWSHGYRIGLLAGPLLLRNDFVPSNLDTQLSSDVSAGSSCLQSASS